MASSPTQISELEAQALYREGRYQTAAAALVPLQDSPTAVRLLGLCRLRQGRVTEALELLERARALAPDDPWTQLHLGMGLQIAGRHAEALELFRQCQAGLPTDPAPCINLASSLLSLGRTMEALRAASDACHRAPEMAEAHYTYGLAWLAVNEPERAEPAFATALRLRPGFPDAWVNFGLVRYRRGDIEGAKTAMRNAIQVSPGHRAATINLAVFLRLTGEVDAGEQLLRELVERHPDAAEARLNLVAELLSEERSAEALDLLQSAVPADPQVSQHLELQRSLALLQLNRADEARLVLDHIGELSSDIKPMLLWRRLLLCLADDDVTGARTLAVEMEDAVGSAGEAMVPEHRIMAHYDLAKFWSHANAPNRAIHNWEQGHAQLRRFQPFSREAYRAFVDQSIESFSFERMHRGPRAGDADPRPVFIVGMPRSGTTLAEQILAAHNQVHGAGERNALNRAFVSLGGGSVSAEAAQRVAGQERAALDQAAAAYLAELQALDPHADRIVDKMPGNFRHLGLVGLMLPGARIIHCERDPRDIGLSIFTFRFHGHGLPPRGDPGKVLVECRLWRHVWIGRVRAPRSWRTRPRRNVSAAGQYGLWRGRSVVQRAVWAHGVEVPAPGFDQHLGFT